MNKIDTDLSFVQFHPVVKFILFAPVALELEHCLKPS